MRSRLLAIAAMLALATGARAAGPLYIYDAAHQAPYAYPGPVRVYTDLGALGGMSAAQAQAATAFAVGQWSSVPTSSFHADVVGTVAELGLPDITGANAVDVLGADNGGGIHVIFDSDGSILRDVLGVPPGVLGVASPEWAEDNSPAIYESWVVINGDVIPDPASISWMDVVAEYTGVITHEFGHAINLAHSQTNGAVLMAGDQPVPGRCDGAPLSYRVPAVSEIETMYPFIQPGWSGAAQSTVDVLDDMVALSNLYPAPTWPASHGSISGTIRLADGITPVMGVNVIARNVANPFADAVSALSGDHTQGLNGSDGRYRLNGLTPGAQYLLYIDGIVAGGFSTPHGILPGPEEFWNGSNESGDALLDKPCEFEPVVASAGQPVEANISFNANPDAPAFTPLEIPGSVITKISQQGDELVGGLWGEPVGFRWSKNRGYEFFPTQVSPTISGNGREVGATQFFGVDEKSIAGYWNGGRDASTIADDVWHPLGRLPDSEGCDLSLTSIWGLSRDGSVAVGHDWKNCRDIFAVKWDRKGIEQLPIADPTSIGSRANTVSGDGAVIAGHETMSDGWWAGVIWRQGKAELIKQKADWWGMFDVFPVGDANGINHDGSVIVGENAVGPADAGYPPSAWRWTRSQGLEVLGYIPCPDWSWFCFGGSAYSQAVSDDGAVVVGWGGDYFDREATIWTRQLGLMTLEDFLAKQDVVSIDGWSLMTAMDVSGDGRVIAGWGGYASNYYGWTLKIDKVKVCHNHTTIDVAFPSSMDVHLGHGDTFGSCAK